MADAIFGLAPGYLVLVREKQGCFGNRMPILSQVASALFRLELRIKLGDHFPRYPVVLDMRVPISKAAPLFPELVLGHFDCASALNELL